MIRLRQVALVARNLEPAVDHLSKVLDVDVCFRDPGVAEFGLVNALLAVGDTFLEVVSPNRPGTTAGRLIQRRGGDGGYMVILQCDDLERRRGRLTDLGVRVVWQADYDHIAGTHLHPRDVGGAIVSIDWADPPSSWAWAGKQWREHVRTDAVTALAGVVVGADDPAAMAARWAEVLDAPLGDDATSVVLDGGGTIRFEPSSARGEGVDGVLVTATDRVRAGEVHHACGVDLRFV